MNMHMSAASSSRIKHMTKAQSKLMSSLMDARQHLRIIDDVVKNHMFIDPDDVRWTEANDATRLADQLGEIVEWLQEYHYES